MTVATSGVDPAVAEEILPVGASRYDFLRTRRTGLGGSDISPLLRMSSYSGPMELWLDKTGQVPLLDTDDDDGPALWGQVLEPVIRRVFARRARMDVSLVGTLRSVERPHLLANLDGVTADGGNLEIKTATLHKAGEWSDGQVADHAELQAQHGMGVTGRPHCWVAALIGGQRLEIRRVDRDDDLIAFIREQADQFWFEHVLPEVEPKPGGAPGTTDYLTGRHPVGGDVAPVSVDQVTGAALLAEYKAGKAQEPEGKLRANAAGNQMRRLLGDAEELLTGDDKVVATWRNTGKLDLDRLTEAHPDLVAEFTRPAPVFDDAAFAAHHPEIYRAYRGRRLLPKG